jgi:hypothetical protein
MDYWKNQLRRGIVSFFILIRRRWVTTFRQATAGKPHFVDIRTIGTIPLEK